MAVDIKKLFNEELPAALAKNAEDAKTIGAKYQMNITGEGEWTIDVYVDRPVLQGGHGARRLHDHDRGRGLPEARREPAGQRHAALLRGQAQGRGQPDARDEAAEALLVTRPEVPPADPLVGYQGPRPLAAPPGAARVARPRGPRRAGRQDRGHGGRRLPPGDAAARRRRERRGADVERLPRAEPQQAERRRRSEEARGEGRVPSPRALVRRPARAVPSRACSTGSASRTQTLLEANPRLVVCALTGYGQTGRSRSARATTSTTSRAPACSASRARTTGPPTVPGFQLADVSGGLYAVIGIMGALMERAQHRQGQRRRRRDDRDGDAVRDRRLRPRVRRASASRAATSALTGGIAPYQTYATKDGEAMTLAALEPKFWMEFCAGVGREVDMSDLVPGPHQAALKEQLRSVFAEKTRDEWVAFAAERDCCLEPVLTRRRGARPTRTSPRARCSSSSRRRGGRSRRCARRSPPPDRAHTPPPLQGEHTDAILRDAGITRRRDREAARRWRDSLSVAGADRRCSDLAELFDELPVRDETFAEQDRQQRGDDGSQRT